MNSKLQQMQEVAGGIVKGILASMPKADVAFKRTIPLPESEGKEVLVLGNVHPAYNDGYCIAVLNPRPALAEQVWLVGGQVREGATYSARQSRSVPATAT